MQLIDLAKEVGAAGAVDIVLMGALVYAVLVLLRRSHAGAALHGLLLVGGLYLLARQFDLSLTTKVLEAFFAVALIALIVIFRDELRRFFEHLSRWSPTRRFGRDRDVTVVQPAGQMLARVLSDMADKRVGALVVISGNESVERHLEGGVGIDGMISEALVASLFDPASPGHDGAMVMAADRVTRFGCHLPLSSNAKVLGGRGTRHAAALGLSERTDALCIVVSEETGRITVAYHGQFEAGFRYERLQARIATYQGDRVAPVRRWPAWFTRNVGLKAAALLISTLLWFVLVHGSKTVLRHVVVPVRAVGPVAHRGVRIEPDRVTLVLEGARRDFYFLERESLGATVRVPYLSGMVRRRLSSANVSHPRHLRVRAITPDHVEMQIGGGRAAPASAR